jgi:hypothetical protein
VPAHTSVEAAFACIDLSGRRITRASMERILVRLLPRAPPWDTRGHDSDRWDPYSLGSEAQGVAHTYWEAH